MLLLRKVNKFCLNNWYLFLGVIIGIFLNLSVTDFECLGKLKSGEFLSKSEYNYSTIKAVIRTNATRKSTKKPAQLIRPRYYSTELGIKEKLFVGVLTSEERIAARAVHVNKTVQHLVDKIKFFITAQPRVRNKLNYTGLVGFTDSRHKNRPFQVIKYIGDNFLQEYDYYFLMNDFDYLNARRLKDLVGKISVSMNVYLGNPVKDSSYCNLDSGILLSNSVMQAMKDNLEWCIKNSVTDDHSENIGRCVYRSTKLDCQDVVQGQRLQTYKLKHFVLEKHLKTLKDNEEFNGAVTVYPVLQKEDYHLLHAYYSKKNLLSLKKDIMKLSEGLTEVWPPGERKGSTPATRFDLPPQFYFNMTHTFFPDDFTIIRKHTKADSEDVNRIIEHVKSTVLFNNTKTLGFVRLVNGYRSFDLSRGLDYKLDMMFKDLKTGEELIKRFEVCKPLGNVEFIPAPYVTENTKISILLPIEETEMDQAKLFIETYTKTVMEHKEKSLLMLVFLYQYNSSSSKGSDVFGELKEMAVRTSGRFRSEDTKIAWVSIRLPSYARNVGLGEFKVLNFALIDLALRKIGLESLVLVLSVYSEVTGDFLNRVRMNTISNFQVFSPIPFRFYNPSIAAYDKMEINKNSGHFDGEEYRFLSFYAKDYVSARKKSQHLVPLTRSDNDIVKIVTDRYKDVGNVFEMFVKFSQHLSPLRAPEMSLRVRYHEEEDVGRRNWFLGTQSQLAKFLFSDLH